MYSLYGEVAGKEGGREGGWVGGGRVRRGWGLGKSEGCMER